MSLTIHNDDNLAVLQRLADAGERFDLIELDGPYGAGLEGWDCLTEDEYLAHYTARLPLVARCLQPWGVSFLFGYPEGCAEIKTWARQSGALHLRRWLTWYKQVTAHKGRKCETVLVMGIHEHNTAKVQQFSRVLQSARKRTGRTAQHMADTFAGGDITSRIGQGLYERPTGLYPMPVYLFIAICTHLNIDPAEWWDAVDWTYEGLTNIDYLSARYPEDSRDLNDAGLRSKPVGLYLDLFRPTIPPRETKRALILYGGSGNAAIAAGQLGYDVTVCETDPARCEYIRRRWAWKVEHRDETPIADLGPLFSMVSA